MLICVKLNRQRWIRLVGDKFVGFTQNRVCESWPLGTAKQKFASAVRP